MARAKVATEPPRNPGTHVPSAVGQNIATIAELEQQWLRERKVGEHLGDGLARAFGTLEMVAFHALLFLGWVGINLGWIPGIPRFDPPPFGLLTLIVSLEAIFLSLFLLVSQNRLTHQADKRMHVDMQINMLAETEITAILTLVRKLCDRVGVDEGPDGTALREMSQPTDVKQVVEAVEKKIPEAANPQRRAR